MAKLRERIRRYAVLYGYWRLPVYASRLRRHWVIFRNPHVDIRFGKDCLLGPGFSLHAPHGGTFHAGNWCEFRRGFRAELLGPDATIEIGDGCRFTYDVTISCATKVTFNDLAATGMAEVTDEVLAEGSLAPRRRPIVVDKGAAVHVTTTIAADVGERVLVAANVAIMDDLPPWTVAGGVPSRVLEHYGPDR